MAASTASVLVHWGERLFYPDNRIVKADPPPRLHGLLSVRAAAVRRRIAAVVSRQAPQAIVRVTGGGRGMSAIASHLRYIGKNGRLPMEDDRGVSRDGPEAVRDIVDQWRHAGRFIGNVEPQREALNLLLSMPAGTDPAVVAEAAREFGRLELVGHRWVMVLHRHQANPHVHLCVKLRSVDGDRLRHGRADLRRWRETFAERLRAHGLDAEATHPAVRGQTRGGEVLWRLKAREVGRLRQDTQPPPSAASLRRCTEAFQCWAHLWRALRESDRSEDRQLAGQVGEFLVRTPFMNEVLKRYPEQFQDVRRYLAPQPQPERQVVRDRPGPELTR